MIVMAEKLSDCTVIVYSSISTMRNVLVKHDRKVYVSVAAPLSPITLGTFGKQFEIHCRPSCCEKRPRTTILDSGNCSSSCPSKPGTRSCKFSGLSGISSRAHRAGSSWLTSYFFSITKALRLPCCPSAVRSLRVTFVKLAASPTRRVVRSILFGPCVCFYSSSISGVVIEFCLHTLSSIPSRSTDYVL